MCLVCVWFWFGFGLCLVCVWFGFGLVLVYFWFWFGFGLVWFGFGLIEHAQFVILIRDRVIGKPAQITDKTRGEPFTQLAHHQNDWHLMFDDNPTS